MNTCHVCSTPILATYYRLGSEMICPGCAARESVNDRAAQGRDFRRGLGHAVGAALLGALGMAGVDQFSLLAGSGIFSLGAFFRGFAVLFLGSFIGSAARAGARGRRSVPLRWCAGVLTYLAYSLAFVPLLLGHMPAARLTPTTVLGVLLVFPAIPVIMAIKAPLAITGLIVVCIAARGAWTIAAKPWTIADAPIELAGPFDVRDKDAEEQAAVRAYVERPMFKGLAG